MNVQNLIKKIENQSFSLGAGFLTLYAIILCRNILESAFESSQILGFSTSNAHSFYMVFIHFPFFYFSLFLWIILTFILLTKENYIKITRTMIMGMVVIIITPIIDIIVSKGSGYHLTYLGGFKQVFEIHKFFDFTRDVSAASWGQRIEIVLVLLGGSIYVFSKTKNLLKAISAIIIMYLIIFLHGAIPNTIAKIPSYLGFHTLSFQTIITNGILPIDSQNYAVIFAISIILAGYLIFIKTKNKSAKGILNLRILVFLIVPLIIGIIYGIFLVLPYYPFIFANPISYLIFLLAVCTIVLAQIAALSEKRSIRFQISIIAVLFFATALGPVFLISTIIFFIIKRFVNIKWLIPIPLFIAGFSVVFQEATFLTIIPRNRTQIEIKGRRLSGWSYFLNNEYAEALNQYQKIYALDKDDEVTKRLAQSNLNLGMLDKSIELLASVKKPDYETVILLGQTYTQKGDFNNAFATYKKALEMHIEPAADFYVKMAHIIMIRKGHEKEIMQITEKARAHGAAKYKIYELKGDFYLSQSNFDKALEMYEQALNYNARSVISLAGLGVVSYNQSKYDRAEEHFLRALKIDPNNDALFNNLGALYFVTNKYPEAEDYFIKSIKKNPNQVEAYYNLGLIYEKMARKDEALAMYQNVLKVNPSYFLAQKKIEELTK